jgi:nitrite reductase (NADH) small subunit
MTELGQIVGAPWSRGDYVARVQSVVDRYERLVRLADRPDDAPLMVTLLLEHPGALRESAALDRRELGIRLEDARTELENVRAAAPIPAPIDRVERTRILALADFEHFIRELRSARRRGEKTVPRSQTLRAVASSVAIRHGVPDFFEQLFPRRVEHARVHVAHESRIAEGTAVRVDAFGRTIAVFRDRGELLAIEDTCPHRGGPLGKGKVAGGAVTCPLHAWTFDLRTGAMRGNPNLCIRKFAVAIDAGEVYVIAPDQRQK